MSKTREQFISELSLMQPASLVDWLMYMTEQSTTGDRAKEFAIPVILAICADIKSRRPESGELLQLFLIAGNELRAEKSGTRWNKKRVQKIKRECCQICTKILALF